MTSIMHPGTYASQMATKAQEALSSASSALFQAPPRPMPPVNRIGIPEENGPDTPDNPWFVGNRPNPPMPIRTPFQAAAVHARTAIQHIDSALGMGSTDMLSRDVLHAFGRAKQQAEAGLREITSPTTRIVDPSGVKLRFDGAGLWLGLAKNLIGLDMRRPNPPVTLPVDPMLPPVKLPVEPGEPGSPITIKPIDPIDLPLLPGGPGKPEVEAPEAIGGRAPLYPGNPDGPVSAEPITIQLPSPDSPVQ